MSSVKNIQTRIQLKHDFEINWIKATGFVPLAGELIVYNSEINPINGAILTTKINGIDTPVVPVSGRNTAYNYARFKLGDGITPVNDLGFMYATLRDDVAKLQTQISYGTADPNAATSGKFYFKYGD